MTITVISVDDHSLRQRIDIEDFDDLFADAPAIVGGDESAPDPHDYFDMALGACKAITARMYARRKDWPLEAVRVEVSRDDREERHGRYTLEVSLTFEGDLDDAQRTRLLEIADRCPIHRLMTDATVAITSRLAMASGA
ncbi:MULTISPECIES: OsmC family protein [unclassified Modicisalibacter]|uniref:OsmC family protein n=1 Tax=unclassified Modicisalibacter TaxID=2679913 RepID=UPI001CC9DFCF|nr:MULTISPECIES: OsmC family protein [unclassified Modicisalibacter]MBZ9556862.1 OsmC family protein [Modicisalibacter sp. R2A 31.J]MBZ9574664.1 OsmC family protein [Modicisalibacter sp. MOD 31.J]